MQERDDNYKNIVLSCSRAALYRTHLLYLSSSYLEVSQGDCINHYLSRILILFNNIGLANECSRFPVLSCVFDI